MSMFNKIPELPPLLPWGDDARAFALERVSRGIAIVKSSFGNRKGDGEDDRDRRATSETRADQEADGVVAPREIQATSSLPDGRQPTKRKEAGAVEQGTTR